MTRSIIAALLDKYWQTETTVEEEKILAAFFLGETVPAEWESYRALFAYYNEEAQGTTSADFDKRLLERIGAADPAAAPIVASIAQVPNASSAAAQDRPPGRIRSLNRHTPWWAAAAVIILSLSAALMTSHPGSPAGSPSTRTGLPTGTQISSTTIKDTYDDPQQALAAIRKALFKASSKINTGRSITKKELTHFNQLQHALSY